MSEINDCNQARTRVTGLLNRWKEGDSCAGDDLFTLVYADLHAMACDRMRGETGHTLQATVLVNEAFLRLAEQRLDWKSRAQFFYVAAKVMRRILVDAARERKALKRGREPHKVSLDHDLAAKPERDPQYLLVDGALKALESRDANLARLVELRFYAGFSMAEIAQLTRLAPARLKRDWETARTWVYLYLQDQGGQAS